MGQMVQLDVNLALTLYVTCGFLVSSLVYIRRYPRYNFSISKCGEREEKYTIASAVEWLLQESVLWYR